MGANGSPILLDAKGEPTVNVRQGHTAVALLRVLRAQFEEALERAVAELCSVACSPLEPSNLLVLARQVYQAAEDALGPGDLRTHVALSLETLALIDSGECYSAAYAVDALLQTTWPAGEDSPVRRATLSIAATIYGVCHEFEKGAALHRRLLVGIQHSEYEATVQAAAASSDRAAQMFGGGDAPEACSGPLDAAYGANLGGRRRWQPRQAQAV